MKIRPPRPVRPVVVNKKKNLHNINRDIRAKEVRLIDEDKKQLGILPLEEALQIAREHELDLVEISPEANPPVCRLLDYGKFLYALQKKSHEAQKQQRKIHIKEIKFTPAIGTHDVEVKMKKIKEFLDEGNKVKLTIWLRGRQKRKPEMLDQMADKITALVKEFCEIESLTKRDKWSCHILIGQKKGGSKDAKTENP